MQMGDFPKSKPAKANLEKEKEKVLSCPIIKYDVNFEIISLMYLQYTSIQKKSRRPRFDFGEELVNLRIQVWWPMDEM